MKYVGLTVGLLFLLIVIYVATRKSLSIEAELAKLTPADRQALQSLASDAGIEVTRLRPVELGVLKYNSRSVAVQDGRVVELRLSDMPLRKTDAVAGLTGLRELWLSGNGLTAVHGLSALPLLRKLNLSHNALTEVAELRGLPALTELDLSDNQLTTIAPLTALPALQTLDVTKNPLKGLPSPTPGGWNVKSDAPAAGKPSNWVASTPPTTGDAKHGGRSGLVEADSYHVSGTIATLHGAVAIANLPGADNAGGADSTLELEVEKGRVRAYLQYVPDGDAFVKATDGYIYAEASPGTPGKIKGVLQTMGGGFGYKKVFHLVVQSMEGQAQGITYRLSR